MEMTLLTASASLVLADQFRDTLAYAFGRYWPDTWTNDNPSLIQNGAYGFHPFHGGAASYIPKAYLNQDMIPTLERVLALTNVNRQHHMAFDSLASSEFHFVLGNDPKHIVPILNYLDDVLDMLKFAMPPSARGSAWPCRRRCSMPCITATSRSTRICANRMRLTITP